MFRWLTVFLFGGVFGAAFGVALGFFLFPYVFPPPEAVDRLTAAEQAKLVAMGTFIPANPNDPIHYGKGGVSVYSATVFLHGDFEVGPGPDFHVYLVPKANIRAADEVTNTMFVDLGRLRAFKGSQKYPVPMRRRPRQISECRHLVPAILGADLASRLDLRARRLTEAYRSALPPARA